MQLFLKILSAVSNSVDPDQTAPEKQSDLGLHCLHMSFCQKLWCSKFRTFSVPIAVSKTCWMSDKQCRP